MPTPTISTPTAVTPAEPARAAPGPGPRRVLVVIDEACIEPFVCTRVLAAARGEPLETFVISPAHGTAATEWYVDEDAARAEATRRLRSCVSCLDSQGIRATGGLADPDPVQAIADALQEFAADEILFVAAPQRPSTWLRRSVIERARRTFTQPIEHIVMPTD